MMVRSHCYCYLFFFISLLLYTLASPTLHRCCNDQRDALLEFKDEFPLLRYETSLSSWNKSSIDCCSWEGVTCDAKSGEVILLELPSISLNSSLKPNSSLFKLLNLTKLSLYNSSLHGEIPSSLGNLSHLTILDFSYNSLVGQVPASIAKLSRLERLELSSNQLVGQVLASLGDLTQLDYLGLGHNNFTGKIPDSFSNLTKLSEVYLNDNYFESMLPLNMSVFQKLGYFDLDLSSNSFRGPLPQWICNLGSLDFLDLSNNSFSGSIPTCLSNIIVSLEQLLLSNNNFSGTLPDIFVNATNLKVLDVSHNHLEGKLPKSLINCSLLQLVNVQSNLINDKFPFWLGSLPSLNVLILRSNQFYGPVYHSNMSVGFQNLRVIDISQNVFAGFLPPSYFSNWRNMATSIEQAYDDENLGNPRFGIDYHNTMEMVHKGVYTEFERIRKDFRAIDFSGNNFFGNIPESIGLLKELRVLNLSGNAFTSSIPQSLENLIKLEALDLSRNNLTGQIPHLGSLSFLSIMNFSHNNLQGQLPRGTQFQRQKCSSFMDNPKLYGLEEICGEIHAPNPTPQPHDLLEPEEQVINWIAAAIAYGPGVFSGLVIGHIFASHKYVWFMEKKLRTAIKRTH
ncbi:hypothetical protein AALP_AA7G176800 [Arabis alpina]|uniref:Leucine-rich repeat-containing N-terminal plant-type domain-containing protein n=1 Tax=Arabis alpina TaxID=50452 RepID=A0A087GIR8_ARAAL|nr:hypothetical protein AALP_AA7G176800 [Arabis alpina]